MVLEIYSGCLETYDTNGLKTQIRTCRNTENDVEKFLNLITTSGHITDLVCKLALYKNTRSCDEILFLLFWLFISDLLQLLHSVRTQPDPYLKNKQFIAYIHIQSFYVIGYVLPFPLQPWSLGYLGHTISFLEAAVLSRPRWLAHLRPHEFEGTYPCRQLLKFRNKNNWIIDLALTTFQLTAESHT